MFELMLSTLRRVDAQYPSRFLATSTTALLSLVTTNLDDVTILSMGIMMRRLFTFARDYQVSADASKPVPDSEIPLQQKLLQSYITYLVDICFQRFSIWWSERFFRELKKNVALNGSKVARESLYEIDQPTIAMIEVVERLAQLAYSFDLDLKVLFSDMIQESVENYKERPTLAAALETQNVEYTEKSDRNSPNGEENEDHGEYSDYDDDDDDTAVPGTPKFDFSSATSPESIHLSKDGLLILITQLQFENRKYNAFQISLSELIKLSLDYMTREDGSMAPLGIQDALLFWGLWVTKDIKPETVKDIDSVLFASYLQILCLVSASSSDSETRLIAYTLSARLLSLHKENVSYDFIIDTLTHCPFENVRDATVRILKDFSLSKNKSKKDQKAVIGVTDQLKTVVESPTADEESKEPAKDIVDQTAETTTLEDKLDSLTIDDSTSTKPIITLDKERTNTIKDLIMKSFNTVKESGGLFSPEIQVFLSWLNFATVVPTGTEFIKSLVSKIEDLERSDDKGEEADHRKAILKLAKESIENRWLK